MTSGFERLSRTVYRGILRWSREHSDAPFTIQMSHVTELLPELRGVKINLQDASAVRYLARFGFEREQANARERELALDRGIEALRLLNTRYHDIVEGMRQTRREKMNRESIKYRLGQVFRHKLFGYKGVIYGFDSRCERDEAWIQQMGVMNPERPFYYALPDEIDCQRLFGGVRLTKYVSEDNIIPLEGSRLVHRALDNYFIGYSESLGRYIPVKRLQFEYPDDYSCKDQDLRPVRDDANILLHPDATDSDGEDSDVERSTNEPTFHKAR